MHIKLTFFKEQPSQIPPVASENNTDLEAAKVESQIETISTIPVRTVDEKSKLAITTIYQDGTNSLMQNRRFRNTLLRYFSLMLAIFLLSLNSLVYHYMEAHFS